MKEGQKSHGKKVIQKHKEREAPREYHLLQNTEGHEGLESKI